MPSIREQIERSEDLVKGYILAFPNHDEDDGDTLYDIDVPGIDKGLRLAGINTPEKAKTSLGRILNIENSNTTPLPFPIGDATTFGHLLGPQYGSKASTDFVKGLIAEHGNDIYVKVLETDRHKRKVGILYLTDKDNNLVNVNTELLKAGLAIPYTAYGDAGVVTEELEGIYANYVNMAKSGDSVGVFSRNAKDPESWNNGYEISAFRDAEIKEQINKSAIKHKRVHSIFNENVSNRGFTLPSKYGASHFYQMGLFNATQKQIGGEKYDYRSDGLAVKAVVLSRLASGKSPILSDSEYKLLRTYDRQLQRPGFGAYLNETVFIPSGMGRVYKEELGFFGSVAGLIGKAIDNTAVFYTSGAFTVDQNYALLEPLDIQYTAIKSNEEPGFFERTLPALTNGFLTTSASLLAYFGFGVPFGMVMSQVFKTSLNNLVSSGLAPNKGWWGNTVGFFARFSSLGPGAAFGGREATAQDIFSLVEEFVNDPGFKKVGFGADGKAYMPISIKYFENKPATIFALGSGLQNHVSRKISALTFETVASVVVNHVIPYERNTILYNDVQNALNGLVEEAGREIEIKLDVNLRKVEKEIKGKTVSRIEVDRSLSNVDNINVEINPYTAGFKRAQRLMGYYNDIFHLIPLNPLNWKFMGGHIKGDNLNFRTIGDVLDFNDIAYMFRPFFDLKNGPLATRYRALRRSRFSLISQGQVRGTPRFIDAAGQLVNTVFISNPAMAYLNASVGHVYYKIKQHYSYTFNDANRFRANSNQIARVEQNLRQSLLREANSRPGLVKGESVEQVTEKLIHVTDDRIEDFVRYLALTKEQSLIFEDRVKNKFFREAEADIAIAKSQEEADRLIAKGNEMLENQHIAKRAKQAGRITSEMFDNKNLRTFAMFSTLISTFALNPFFNSGAVAILEQLRVNSLLGKEDSMVHFTAAGSLISSNRYWVALTTASTIGFSLAAGAAFTNLTNDFVNFKPQLSENGLKTIDNLDGNEVKKILKGFIGEQNIDNIAESVLRSLRLEANDINVKKLQPLYQVKTNKYKSRLLTNAMYTWGTIQIGLGAIRGSIAIGGNIFNRLTRGKSKNTLTHDAGLLSDLALMQTNISNRVQARGYSTELDVISTFGIENLMSQLQVVENGTGPNNRNTRVYASQIPLFAIQFLVAAEVQTYYDVRSEENRNKVLFKFGIQSHQMGATNFLAEAPILYLPQERGKGPLGWVRQFQWNNNPSNAFTALTDVTTLIGGAVTGLLAFSVIGNAILGGAEAFTEGMMKSSIKGVPTLGLVMDSLFNDTLRRTLNVNSSFIQILSTASDFYTGLFGLAIHPSKVLTIDVMSELTKSLFRSSIPNKPKTAGGARKYFNALNGKEKLGIAVGYLFSNVIASTAINTFARGFFSQEVRDSKAGTIGIGLASIALGAGVSTYAYTNYLRAADGNYRKVSSKTSNIFRGLTRNANVIENRFLKSASPKLVKHLGGYFAAASAIALLVTNRDFGLTQEMDKNPIEQLMTITMYGAGIGAIYGGVSYVIDSPGALFAIYGAALNIEKKGPKWLSRTLKDVTNRTKQEVLKLLDGYKSDHANFYNTQIKKLVDGNDLTKEGKEIFKNVSALTPDDLNITSEQFRQLGFDDPDSISRQIAYKLNSLLEDIYPDGTEALRRHRSAAGHLEAKQMEFERLYFGGEIVRVNNLEMTSQQNKKLTINRLSNKQFRATSSLVSTSRAIKKIVLGTTLTSLIGGIGVAIQSFIGSRSENLSSRGSIDNYFINTDGETKQQISSARAFNNVLRIVTGNDRKVTERYIETNLGQIQIQEGQKLRKVTDSEFSRLTRSLEAIQAMGILNSSNVFISVSPLGIGYSLRNDEKGIRVTPYTQFQVPGFDISTAVYNMSRKYDFKSGYVNKKNQHLLQREVQKYNDMANSPDISEADLRYQQVVVARAYASLDPNSAVSKRSVTPLFEATQTAQIGSSKIMSLIVRDRMRTAKQFRYMSVSDLYNSSFDFSNISVNSLLTEQIIANEMVNNPDLPKALQDRQISMRLSFHLKNKFFGDNIKGNFAVQQALLNGMLSEGNSEFGPNIRPRENPNGAMEVINNTIGNVTSLLRTLSGNQPIVFHAFQAFGLVASVSFVFSTLSVISKAGSPDLSSNNNFLLSRMFGTSNFDNANPIFTNYKVSLDGEGVIQVVNNAPIFASHPGELVYRISIKDGDALFKAPRSIIDKTPVVLNRAVRKIHGANNRFLENLFNMTNVAESQIDMQTSSEKLLFFFEEAETRSWFGTRGRTAVGVNYSAFKESLTTTYLDYLGLVKNQDGELIPKEISRTSKGGIFQALDNSFDILIRTMPAEDRRALSEFLGVGVSNTDTLDKVQLKNKLLKQLNVLDSLTTNYNSFLNTIEQFFKETTFESQLDEIRYIDIGYIAKNVDEAAVVTRKLVNTLINDYIKKELTLIQRGLGFLDVEDINNIIKVNTYLKSIAKYSGGAIDLIKDKFKRTQAINPRVSEVGRNLFKESRHNALNNNVRQPKARRTLTKTLGDIGGQFTTAFSAITIFTDLIDSYGYTSQLGLAMADGSYTEAELDYMAYESGYVYGRNLYSSILIGSGLTLGTAGVGATFNWLTTTLNMSKFIAGGLMTVVAGATIGGSLLLGNWASKQDNKYLRQSGNYINEGSRQLNNLMGTIGLLKKDVIESTGAPRTAASVIGSLEILSFVAAASWTTTAATAMTIGKLLFVGGGAAAAVSGGLVIVLAAVAVGLLIGLSGLDKWIGNSLMSVNRTISNNFGMVGAFFSTPEGSAMTILDDVSSGPISFATPRQALAQNAAQFYNLGNDTDNTSTMNFLFGSIGSSRSSTVGAIMGEATISFGSKILNSILISRAKYFRQMIVGKAIWRMQIEEAANVLELKRDLQKEVLYKETVTQQSRDVDNQIRKDQEELQVNVTKARDTSDEMMQAMAVMHLANSKRNTIEPTTIDSTKQRKVEAVLNKNETDNRYLAFVKDSINYLADFQTVLVEKVEVARVDDNNYIVERSISNRNDVATSIANRSIYVNSYA